MRLATFAAFLALLSVAAGAAAAPKFVVLAFGDSITRGDRRFDEENRGGYPGRLEVKLRADNPDAEVRNLGRDGETTSEGLSRLLGVLSNHGGDAIVIMEGSNDVDLVNEGLISLESIEANLAAMANRAANAGLDVTLGTLLPRPPYVRRDSSNAITFGATRLIRELAFRQRRAMVDVYDLFFYEPRAILDLYAGGTNDVVGHPNAAGFAHMADAFYDHFSGIDSESPSVGELLPGFRVPELRPGQKIELVIYDLGTGIDAETVTLTINGQPIETDHTGNMRRRVLTHQATADSLSCFARLGFEASDLADPANVAEKALVEYRVDGGRILNGDLNKSCRVDGVDLVILAIAFGARDGEPRYSKTADIDGNGVINGRDFAELASNFGRSSS